jgi:ATP/ADP translocase
MGTLGSIVASQVPVHLATELGTKSLYLFSLPLYLIVIYAYRWAFQHSSIPKEDFAKLFAAHWRPRESISWIFKSHYLILILLLVILMQGSVGLLEYQFNLRLSLEIPETDMRTAYCGKLVGWTNLLSILFQILGSLFMIQSLGLRKSHLLVPSLLLSITLLTWIIPSFALLSLSFILLKAIDFSFFGVIREMLYIPLQFEEKFRIKALIDVFAYRSSKACISLIILTLQLLLADQMLHLASYLSMAIFLIWIGVVYILTAPREDRVERI